MCLLFAGLDFPDIQHVINFDMPADIENYVHRYVLSVHASLFTLPPILCGLT